MATHTHQQAPIDAALANKRPSKLTHAILIPMLSQAYPLILILLV